MKTWAQKKHRRNYFGMDNNNEHWILSFARTSSNLKCECTLKKWIFSWDSYSQQDKHFGHFWFPFWHFRSCCHMESFESQTRGVSNLLDFKLPDLNTHIYVHDTKSCFQIENQIMNCFNIFISNIKYVLHKLRKAWFILILIKVT